MGRLGGLVAAGRTSDVYEFGPGSVVKVPRPQVPDHWALLEAEFTSAVRTLDVPAPSVIDVTQIDGRHAIVFERIDGHSMWQHMHAEPDQIPALARTLAETHRQIFAAGPPDGVDGLVDRMKRKLADVEQLTDSDRNEAAALTDRLPKGATLLHGDLHPGNVLMTRDGPVAIDWFDASIGHPVSDVIRSSILMRPLVGAVEPPHLPGADRAMMLRMHSAYVEAMAGVLMSSGASLQHWEALTAASRLAEGAQPDAGSLVELWRQRNDVWSSPLANVLSGLSNRSGPAAPR